MADYDEEIQSAGPSTPKTGHSPASQGNQHLVGQNAQGSLNPCSGPLTMRPGHIATPFPGPPPAHLAPPSAEVVEGETPLQAQARLMNALCPPPSAPKPTTKHPACMACGRLSGCKGRLTQLELTEVLALIQVQTSLCYNVHMAAGPRYAVYTADLFADNVWAMDAGRRLLHRAAGHQRILIMGAIAALQAAVASATNTLRGGPQF